MRKPVQSAFFVLFLLVGVCIPLSVFARYEIILKGGNMIETDSYYEEGDIVKYHRFGTYIGIGKDSIREIRETEEAANYEEIIPDAALFEKHSSDHSTENGNDKRDSSGVKISDGLTRSASGSQAAGTGKKVDGDQIIRRELYFKLQNYEAMKKQNCDKNDYESQRRCMEAEAGLKVVKNQLKKMGLPTELPK